MVVGRRSLYLRFCGSDGDGGGAAVEVLCPKAHGEATGVYTEYNVYIPMYAYALHDK